MVRIDENQEVIAQICMHVNIHDQERMHELDELNETDGDVIPPIIEAENHWTVGSPLPRQKICEFQENNCHNSIFRQFTHELIGFLEDVIDAAARPSQPYEVSNSLPAEVYLTKEHYLDNTLSMHLSHLPIHGRLAR